MKSEMLWIKSIPEICSAETKDAIELEDYGIIDCLIDKYWGIFKQ